MLYSVAHVLVYVLARLCFRLRVIGEDNVPPSGGAIIAANHSSYLDIPLLGCALKRRADFIGKSELFKNRIVGFLFRSLGGFPVKRAGVDRSAIAEAVRRLKAGRLVVFYPEGRRSENGQLQEGKLGIGMIASQAKVPIVPAFIEGTAHVLPKESWFVKFRPITIRFGKPLDPSLFAGTFPGKELYTEISRAAMEGIDSLSKEASCR